MANAKTIKYGIGGTIIAGVLSWMIFSGISQNMVYFLKVDEFVAKGSQIYGKKIRLNGDVAKGSIKKSLINGKTNYRFQVTNGKNGKNFISVSYNGIAPDTFEEEKEVILEGKYLAAEKLFTATKLMTKCPSKYDQEDTPEVIEHKKKMQQEAKQL